MQHKGRSGRYLVELPSSINLALGPQLVDVLSEALSNQLYHVLR